MTPRRICEGKLSIPRPSEVIARQLRKAPNWVQALVRDVVAVLQWIGLPAAVLGFVTDRAWVLDLGRWLVDRAGLLAIPLTLVGDACAIVVRVWHGITAPVVGVLSEFLSLQFPPWGVDLLAIVLLLAVGRLRAAIKLRTAEFNLVEDFLRAVDKSGEKFGVSLERATKANRTQVMPLIRLAASKEFSGPLFAEIKRRNLPIEKAPDVAAELWGEDDDDALGVGSIRIVAAVALWREQDRRSAHRVFVLYGIGALICLLILAIDGLLANSQ